MPLEFGIIHRDTSKTLTVFNSQQSVFFYLGATSTVTRLVIDTGGNHKVVRHSNIVLNPATLSRQAPQWANSARLRQDMTVLGIYDIATFRIEREDPSKKPSEIILNAVLDPPQVPIYCSSAEWAAAQAHRVCQNFFMPWLSVYPAPATDNNICPLRIKYLEKIGRLIRDDYARPSRGDEAVCYISGSYDHYLKVTEVGHIEGPEKRIPVVKIWRVEHEVAETVGFWS